MLTYRKDVQVLRGIAVLLVASFHIFPEWVPSGYIGVDVFFVISGYLILGSIQRQVTDGSFGYVTFLARRVKRLLPPLVTMILVCLVVAPFVFIPSELLSFSHSALSSIFYVSNFYFEIQASYFDTQLKLSPLLHTWSLSVEEQFYLVAPLFLILIWRWSPKRIETILCLVTFLGFLLSLSLFYTDPGFAYFASPARFWQFLLGGIVATTNCHHSVTHRTSSSCTALGVTALVAIGSSQTSSTSAQFLAIFAATVTTAALIWLGNNTPDRKPVLRFTPLERIGNVSYSIYLWHWPVLVFTTLLAAGTIDVFDRWIVMITALVLGFLSWRLVEVPIKSIEIKSSTRNIWQTAFVATALAGSAAYVLPYLPIKSYAATNHALTAYLNYDWKSRFRYGSCFITKDHGSADQFDWSSCVDQGSEKPRLLLIGDSHAAHWSSAIRQHYGLDFAISQITSAGCRPGLPLEGEDWCTEILEKAISEEFLRSINADVILIGGRWREPDIPNLINLLNRLESFSTSTYVIGPVPEYALPLPRLLLKHRTNQELMKFSKLDGVKHADKALESSLEARSTEYLSVLNVLCAEMLEECITETEDGSPLAFDYGHLTHDGAVTLLEKFERIGPILNTKLNMLSGN